MDGLNEVDGKYYILTGWSSNGVTAHAVNILIERQPLVSGVQLYKVNIINSGAGYQTYHVPSVLSPNKNLIMKYQNVPISIINDIIRLSFLSFNPEFAEST